MDLEEAIQTRRSIRKFQEKEVPIELILKAIDLACWAPNASNLQAWRFFVVTNKEKISKMADALEAKANLIATWPEVAGNEALVNSIRNNASTIRNAPAIVAIGALTSEGGLDLILKQRAGDPIAEEMVRSRSESNSNAQTVSSAAAHLLLALHGLGLGGCWMGGPMLARKELEEVLAVPSGVHLYMLTPVGYPSETPAPKPRKQRDEVVSVL